MVSINMYPFAFEAPGPAMDTTDDFKFNYNKISTASVDLKDYPAWYEMLGAEIYFRGPIYNPESYTARVEFFNNDNNVLLWSGSVTMEKPSSNGYEYWDWYRINFWIGHKFGEINSAMPIRMEIYVTGSLNRHETLYMNVKDTSPHEEPPATTIKSKKRIELELRDLNQYGLVTLVAPQVAFIGGGLSMLLSKIPELKTKVQAELPNGWYCTEITLSGKKLYIDLEERGSPELVITTTLVIIGIIAAVLILLGIIVVSYKVVDTYNNKIEYNKLKDKFTLAEEVIALGIDPELAAKIISGLDTPSGEEESTLDKLEDIMLVAIVGMLIIAIVQQQSKK